jgi:formiminoglutamate deiminase
VTEDEVSRLATSGAVAGLCPVTEANLGDGVFPAQAYLAHAGTFGVGTDSNVLIDPAQELRTLEYGQRLAGRARNVLASAGRPSTGASLFVGALAGGARALGQARFGLEVGASADVVCLNLNHPSLYGRSGDALLDGWILAGAPGIVTTVWRRGVKVVRHSRHCDADQIAQRYRRTLDKLTTS